MVTRWPLVIMACALACEASGSEPTPELTPTAPDAGGSASSARDASGQHGSMGSLLATVSSQSRDWAFIQTIGGIAIGAPYRGAGGGVYLPIDCEVSGTRTITVKPTKVYSALTCQEPVVRVQGPSVYITVRTGFPSDRYPNARCPDANLGELAPGSYAVLYASPDGGEHPLGSIVIDVPRP